MLPHRLVHVSFFPFSLKEKNGHVEIVRILVRERADLEAEFRGKTPLSIACMRGHKPVVEILLRHGANPSVKDSEGNSCLDLARKHSNRELVSLLKSRITATI